MVLFHRLKSTLHIVQHARLMVFYWTEKKMKKKSMLLNIYQFKLYPDSFVGFNFIFFFRCFNILQLISFSLNKPFRLFHLKDFVWTNVLHNLIAIFFFIRMFKSNKKNPPKQTRFSKVLNFAVYFFYSLFLSLERKI